MSLFLPSATLWGRVTTGCQTAQADKDHLLCSPATQTWIWNSAPSTKPEALFTRPKKQICNLESIQPRPSCFHVLFTLVQTLSNNLSVGGTTSRWAQTNPRMSDICPSVGYSVPPPSTQLILLFLRAKILFKFFLYASTFLCCCVLVLLDVSDSAPKESP